MSEDKVYDYTIDQLRARVKELEEENAALNEMIDKTTSELSAVRADNKRFEDENETFRSQCSIYDLRRAVDAEARVKKLEAALSLDPSKQTIEASLRYQRDKAEAQVKELEARIKFHVEVYGLVHAREQAALARVKELEAERDDLLRLGNNHK